MNIEFDTRQNILLENEKVALIPLATDNYQQLIAYAYEEEIWHYYPMLINNKETLEQFFRNALAGRSSGTEYPFVVLDKRSQEIVGSTRFYEIMLSQQRIQVGYTWFGSEFHGSGINKNCKFLMLEFAFETLHMERVEFRADSRNARSISAMKSIGCTAEGILRSYMPLPDGTRRNTIVLSILKHEWFGRLKNLLLQKITP